MNGLSSRYPLGGFLCGAARRALLAAALVPCVGPRRVPPRRAGNFHLLAQMKVTKAKGLEHQPFDLLASATRLLPRLWHENVQRTTLSVTSLTLSRSSSFRLDPKGPRRDGVPRWSRFGLARAAANKWLQAAARSNCATGAAAKAQPVAAHPLGSSVALPMGRTRQSACSRSETAKWAGVQALCFGDFHLGQQMKVTREPGRDPAGCSAMHQSKPGAAPNKPVQAPAGSLKGNPP
jgi:hypothetical protein